VQSPEETDRNNLVKTIKSLDGRILAESMKLTKLLHGVAGATLMTLALGSCAGLPGADQGSPLPAAPDSSSGTESAVPDTRSPIPRPSCEGGPFGCRTFTSTEGRDASGDLEWLQSQPLVVSSAFVNGTWMVGVKTPCNHMSVKVSVEGNQLIPGQTISTAMACSEPASGFESWTRELFEQTVQWELTGESLLLQNGHGIVVLKDSGPSTKL
jgi:heat shock protein HslJ